MKMLITLEPYGIFGTNVAYLFVLICPATGMQNGDKEMLSIVLAGRRLLVKIMLITLEPHVILKSNFAF